MNQNQKEIQFNELKKKHRAKELKDIKGVLDFGEVTPEEWEKIYRAWENLFGGGRFFFCVHDYGLWYKIPRGIKATVVYPNGVKVEKDEEYDYVLKCGKCGRVKGVPRSYE